MGWPDPPSSYDPPVVPAESGPKLFRLKSSWRQRRRSKILAVSPKHWKGRRGGSRGGGRLLLWLSAVLIHPCLLLVNKGQLNAIICGKICVQNKTVSVHDSPFG